MKKNTVSVLPLNRVLLAQSAVLAAALATLSSQAATHTFSGATSGNTTWSSGTNWSTAPASSSTSNLTFSGSYTNGTAVVSNNDIVGNFALNTLYVNTAGPASGSSSLTVMGNALEFVSNGGTTPTILLSSTGTTRPSFTLNNNLILTNNTRLSQGRASVRQRLVTLPSLAVERPAKSSEVQREFDHPTAQPHDSY
jgi:hypothetical protein